MSDVTEAAASLATVIYAALQISEAEVADLLQAARRQETLMPFMDPTRWRREGDDLAQMIRVLEAFTTFRAELAQTPAGKQAAQEQGGQ